MEKREKTISTHEFFPFVKELLKENRQAVFTVSGYSMLPFIGNRRDQVCLDSCDCEHLSIGDIILFQKYAPPYDYILHRIYAITQNGYQTMGDGNDFMDEPIVPEQVIGIVKKIYRRDKEIDCRVWWFRWASNVWRWFRPFRTCFMGSYRKLSVWKKKIKKRKQEG